MGKLSPRRSSKPRVRYKQGRTRTATWLSGTHAVILASIQPVLFSPSSSREMTDLGRPSYLVRKTKVIPSEKPQNSKRQQMVKCLPSRGVPHPHVRKQEDDPKLCVVICVGGSSLERKRALGKAGCGRVDARELADGLALGLGGEEVSVL